MRLEWILVLIAGAVVWAAKAEEVSSKTLRVQTVRVESVQLDGQGSKVPLCNILRARWERKQGMVADTSSALVKKADKEFQVNDKGSILGAHTGEVDETSGKFNIVTVNPKTLMGYFMIRSLEGKLGKGDLVDIRQIWNSDLKLVCQLTITNLAVADVVPAASQAK